jgi:hypothetical protein
MPDDGLAMPQTRTLPNAHSTRAPVPAVRAAVFALVGTVLGVSAHHLVTGGQAPWAAGAVGAVVLFAVGLAGALRPRSLSAVVVASAAAQVGLHEWLGLMAGLDGGSGAMAHVRGSHVMAGGSGMGDAHAMSHARMHDSVAMTTAHAVVAVLVAVLLHRADAVCWSLARGVAGALRPVQARIARVLMAWSLADGFRVTAEPQPCLWTVRWLERPPPKDAALADVVVRRGPPTAGFVLAF